MKSLAQSVRTAARVGYATAAWTLVAMVVVQVFHAGMAVLVHPGDWQAHASFGSLVSIPVMLMALLSLAGWMPVRFFLLSLGLFLLYILQYLLIYLPGQAGLSGLAALHPVNALLIFGVALHAARSAWRLVTAGWGSARRAGLAAAAAGCALWVAVAGLHPAAGWGRPDSGAGAKAPSLADASESGLPPQYRQMQRTFAPGDAEAVAAGQQIAQQRCIACHAADFKGRQLGSVRSANLTQSAATRSEQFLMWAISEGSERGMPAWKSQLTEQERWQLVAFIKSLKQ